MGNIVIEKTIQEGICTDIKTQLLTIASKLLDKSNHYSTSDLEVDLLKVIKKVEGNSVATDVLINEIANNT